MSQGEDSHHEAHKGYLASAALVCSVVPPFAVWKGWWI